MKIKESTFKILKDILSFSSIIQKNYIANDTLLAMKLKLEYLT